MGTTAGSLYDQTKILGRLTLDDPIFSLNLGFKPAPGDAFTLFDLGETGSLQGTFDGLDEGSIFAVDSELFRISYRGGRGNDVVLSFVSGSAVPEPGSWILLASGLGLLLLMARFLPAASPAALSRRPRSRDVGSELAISIDATG